MEVFLESKTGRASADDLLILSQSTLPIDIISSMFQWEVGPDLRWWFAGDELQGRNRELMNDLQIDLVRCDEAEDVDRKRLHLPRGDFAFEDKNACLEIWMRMGFVTCTSSSAEAVSYMLTTRGRQRLQLVRLLENPKLLVSKGKGVPMREKSVLQLWSCLSADGWTCRVKQHKIACKPYTPGKSEKVWSTLFEKLL